MGRKESNQTKITSYWTNKAHLPGHEDTKVLINFPSYIIKMTATTIIGTLPPIYLSLSNSRWKRIENARKTH